MFSPSLKAAKRMRRRTAVKVISGPCCRKLFPTAVHGVLTGHLSQDLGKEVYYYNVSTVILCNTSNVS